MTAPRWFAGIDPGASGGMAVIPPGKPAECHAFKSEAEALVWLRSLKEQSRGSLTLCLESPGFFFGGPAGNAQAKLHSNVGWWRGAAQALDLSPLLVAPQTWQKPYKDALPSGLANREARKRKLKEIALKLFKASPVTLKTCDALLLARHAQLLCKHT